MGRVSSFVSGIFRIHQVISSFLSALQPSALLLPEAQLQAWRWRLFCQLPLFAFLLLSCNPPVDEKLLKTEQFGCEPCLVPRSNSAVLEFDQRVAYFYTNNDDYHVGKISTGKLTIALVKTEPDPLSTLTVLTRDTLVMFKLTPDKNNVARIYKFSKP